MDDKKFYAYGYGDVYVSGVKVALFVSDIVNKKKGFYLINNDSDSSDECFIDCERYSKFKMFFDFISDTYGNGESVWCYDDLSKCFKQHYHFKQYYQNNKSNNILDLKIDAEIINRRFWKENICNDKGKLSDFVDGDFDILDFLLNDYYKSNSQCEKFEEGDAVNHPSHYTYGKFECIDVIKDVLGKDGYLSYCLGNSIKYLFRCQHKGSYSENIKKAIWYLNAILKEVDNG